MPSRSTSSEYQPVPPIVGLPGRGSFGAGPKGSTGVAIGNLEANPPPAWKLVVRIGSSSVTTSLAANGPYTLECGSQIGISQCPVVKQGTGGGTTMSATAQGITFSVDATSDLTLSILPSAVLPGYFLGQKLRVVLEWSPTGKPNLTGAVDDTITAVAYINGSGDTISASLNGIDPLDSVYRRQFAGTSTALGAFVRSAGTVITDNDAIQALEVAAPAATAYYGVHPSTAAILNWTADITGEIDTTFAVEGDALMPGDVGTAYDASTDTVVFRIQNENPTPLTGTIKALSIYALFE